MVSAMIDSEREEGLDAENKENVLDMAEENPGVSMRRISIELHYHHMWPFGRLLEKTV